MSLSENFFPGRVALQQRVLPAYRVSFFDTLAESCKGGLSVFAGQPIPEENIKSSHDLNTAEYSPAINRHFLKPNSKFYRCDQPGIIDWLQKSDPDTLIIEANTRYPGNRKAIEWMHKNNKPVIGWGLGAPETKGLIGIWKRSRRHKLLTSLDAVVAYSTKGAEEYITIGLSKDKVYTAYNAVQPRPSIQVHRKEKAAGDRLHVLFVGRLQARKKIDNLLQACSELPENLQPKLIVIGDGPAGQQFKSIAEKVYPETEFPGALHGSELDQYFKKSDLFVLPGTGGLAVQQAMAYALPVIVAEGDGTQDDLVKEDNGWLVKKNDIESLRQSLYEALSDPGDLRLKGESSFQIIRDEINIENMVSIFVQALLETRYLDKS